MLDAVTLTGSLVRLQPVGPEHVPALVEASSEDPGAYRWNTMPRSEPAMADYVADAVERWRQGDTLAFATIRRSDDLVVGCTRFTRAEHWAWAPDSPLRRADGTPDVVEIGYTWLAASAQRTGINVEAKRLMLAHAFDVWSVHRVSLDTDVRNHQSRQAIEALGARFEGVIRAERIGADGTVRDSARFSIIAAEWPDVRAHLDRRLAAWARHVD
ncbi:MAG: GNAT family N-acetyltransferase [Acidimicrobiales bacterium]